MAAALTLVETPDKITVLHVVEPVGAIATLGDERNREAQEHLQDTLDKLRAELAPLPGGQAVGAAVRFGPAAEAIAGYAKDKSCDLVVMPSSRRSGVKRLLLGSVTEQVLRKVHAAVLVVREFDDED